MNNKGEWVHRLQADVGLIDREETERVLKAVLTTLRSRIMPQEADDLEAQLPEDLKPLWRGNVLQKVAAKLTGPDTLNYEQFLNKIADDLDVSTDRALEFTRAVFHLIKEQVSPGEADQVCGQLPKALKVVWLEA